MDNYIIDDVSDTPSTTSQGRMKSAKDYFANRLAALPTQVLKKIFEKINETGVSKIELEGKKEAALMFELQNNRGKELTNMEKLKSYLMYQLYVYSEMDDIEGNIEYVTNLYEQIYSSLNALSDIPDMDEDRILVIHCQAWINEFNYRTIEEVKSSLTGSSKKVDWIKQFVYELSRTFDSMKLYFDDLSREASRLKDMKPEEMQATITKLQQDLKDKDSEYAAKEADRIFQDTLKEAIKAAGGRNEKAVMALLDLDTLKESKDQSADIKKALDAAKESDSYLFGADEPFFNPVGPTNDKGGNTEDIIAFSIGGSVVTGGSSSFSFAGAIGVNVIGNAVSAAINNAVINANGDINTTAYSNMNVANVAGSASISTSKGAGVGIGTIVNVINNEITAGINNSTVENSYSVIVSADADEVLRFLAVNFGVSTQGATILANAIVNVLNSNINSYITNGKITSSGEVTAASDYNTSIVGNTDVVSVSAGSSSVSFGANIVTNVLTNDTTSNVNSNIKAGGKVGATANSTENIDIIPVSVAATAGSAGVAANIGANVILNNTMASVGGTVTNSTGVDVIASDTTDLKSRGGVITGGAKAGVGGSIIVDVLNKNVHFDKIEEILEDFDSPCLMVGIQGQTKEMIRKDIEILTKYFDHGTINIYRNNSTPIKRDEELIKWFDEEYHDLKNNRKYDYLGIPTDFGVGD